jgi:hypothetical protein
MTNKTKLLFAITATICAVLSVLISTRFAVDTAYHSVAVVANALGLHGVPTPFVPVALGAPVSICILYSAGEDTHDLDLYSVGKAGGRVGSSRLEHDQG